MICFAIAFNIALNIGDARGQLIWFPLDNGGYAQIKYNNNTLYINGIVHGEEVPW